MSNTDSRCWTWTLGLLTAASACFVPVGAEAAVDGAADRSDALETWNLSADPIGLRALPDSALQADHRTERRATSANESDTDRPALDARLPLLNLVRTRSQLLLEPGPPIYLVAPSQSPPGSSGGV